MLLHRFALIATLSLIFNSLTGCGDTISKSSQNISSEKTLSAVTITRSQSDTNLSTTFELDASHENATVNIQNDGLIIPKGTPSTIITTPNGTYIRAPLVSQQSVITEHGGEVYSEIKFRYCIGIECTLYVVPTTYRITTIDDMPNSADTPRITATFFESIDYWPEINVSDITPDISKTAGVSGNITVNEGVYPIHTSIRQNGDKNQLILKTDQDWQIRICNAKPNIGQANIKICDPKCETRNFSLKLYCEPARQVENAPINMVKTFFGEDIIDIVTRIELPANHEKVLRITNDQHGFYSSIDSTVVQEGAATKLVFERKIDRRELVNSLQLFSDTITVQSCDNLMLSCTTTRTPITVAIDSNLPPLAKISPIATDVFRNTEITLSAAQSSDPEGASLNYNWRIVGTRQDAQISFDAQENTATFIASSVGTYKIKLTVNDGVTDSNDFLLDIPVVNRAPQITQIKLTPDNPTTTTDLSVTSQAIDADNDELNISYQWKVNGSLISDENTPTLDSTLFHKNDEVSAIVTVSDSITSTVEMRNTVITNSPPRFAQDLSKTISSGYQFANNVAEDDDGDDVTLKLLYGPTAMSVSGNDWQWFNESPMFTHTQEFHFAIEASDGTNTTEKKFTITIKDQRRGQPSVIRHSDLKQRDWVTRSVVWTTDDYSSNPNRESIMTYDSEDIFVYSENPTSKEYELIWSLPFAPPLGEAIVSAGTVDLNSDNTFDLIIGTKDSIYRYDVLTGSFILLIDIDKDIEPNHELNSWHITNLNNNANNEWFIHTSARNGGEINSKFTIIDPADRSILKSIATSCTTATCPSIIEKSSGLTFYDNSLHYVIADLAGDENMELFVEHGALYSFGSELEVSHQNMKLPEFKLLFGSSGHSIEDKSQLVYLSNDGLSGSLDKLFLFDVEASKRTVVSLESHPYSTWTNQKIYGIQYRPTNQRDITIASKYRTCDFVSCNYNIDIYDHSMTSFVYHWPDANHGESLFVNLAANQTGLFSFRSILDEFMPSYHSAPSMASIWNNVLDFDQASSATHAPFKGPFIGGHSVGHDRSTYSATFVSRKNALEDTLTLNNIDINNGLVKTTDFIVAKETSRPLLESGTLIGTYNTTLDRTEVSGITMLTEAPNQFIQCNFTESDVPCLTRSLAQKIDSNQILHADVIPNEAANPEMVFYGNSGLVILDGDTLEVLQHPMQLETLFRPIHKMLAYSDSMEESVSVLIVTQSALEEHHFANGRVELIKNQPINGINSKILAANLVRIQPTEASSTEVRLVIVFEETNTNNQTIVHYDVSTLSEVHRVEWSGNKIEDIQTALIDGRDDDLRNMYVITSPNKSLSNACQINMVDAMSGQVVWSSPWLRGAPLSNKVVTKRVWSGSRQHHVTKLVFGTSEAFYYTD